MPIYNKQSSFELIINTGDEDEFRVQGFKQNPLFTFLFYVFGFLTAGLLFLFGYWYPVKRFIYTHTSCSLNRATAVLIYQFNVSQYFVSEIIQIDWSSEEELSVGKDGFAKLEEGLLSRKIRYFEHMFLRYYFKDDMNQIVELSGYDKLTVGEIYKLSSGINHDAKSKIKIYGDNYINVPIKSVFVIFFQMAANPFYIFQAFSFTVWYIDEYVIFPTIILLMTFVSLAVGTYDTRKHVKNLHKMVGKETVVNVVVSSPGGGNIVSKSSKELVPGDVVYIPRNGMEVPCDMVLLQGQCTVNESALTGESFPATKTSLDSITSEADDIMTETYSVALHKNHTLYNGTQILQASSIGEAKVTALVISTGFSTIKGRLIKSIIFPKPVKFKFFRDSMRFIFCLAVLGGLGFIYTAIMFSVHGKAASVIIIRALDIITIIISPALPTCMTIGLMYAVKRLKRNQIFCTDPARVNICGKIKMFVFDKTGTLTEDKLAISGVVASDCGVLDALRTSTDGIADTMVKAMASCHSLSYINGQLAGDPLDTYMFNFTNWSFLGRTGDHNDAISVVVPPSTTPDQPQEDKLQVIKLYPFHSSLQRMSVIVKDESSGFTVFTKGSPEIILSMCTEESKPDNILEILERYAKDGFRLLAVSTKRLSSNYDLKPNGKVPRSDVECNLTFLGFIVFENALKPTSSNIIKTLDAGNIRVAMATGDNLYTAVAVAREVGIIKSHQKIVKIEVKDEQAVSEVLQSPSDEVKEGTDNMYYSWSSHALNYTFVLTGESYMSIKEKYPDLHRKVLVAGSVFARMSPDQKTIVINDLKNLGYGVGMCGDGANDCGALKAAHAGIALSTSEASVASPFTSTKFDISCVPILIREGRSTLVTSFSAFKYLALYCFIQFFGVLILYSMKSNYADYQFLYADLILCFPLIFTMIQGESSDRLISKRPPGRLFHPVFLCGILVQIAIQFFFQLGVCQYVAFVNWYKPPAYFHNLGEEFMNYENYVVLMVSFYQYIWLSLVYYPGRPYNRPLYTNYKYMIAVAITVILTIIINFHPGEFLRKALEFPHIPDNIFNVSIFCTAVLNLYISYIVECFFQTSNLCRIISRKLLRKTKSRNAYKHIISEMHNVDISNGKVV